jgi:hypothetical protein
MKMLKTSRTKNNFQRTGNIFRTDRNNKCHVTRCQVTPKITTRIKELYQKQKSVISGAVVNKDSKPCHVTCGRLSYTPYKWLYYNKQFHCTDELNFGFSKPIHDVV